MTAAWKKAQEKSKQCKQLIKEVDEERSKLVTAINYAENQNHRAPIDCAEANQALENLGKMKRKLEEARDNHDRRSDELYVDSVRKKCDNKMKALKQSAEALNLFNSDDEESDQE